MEPKDVTIEILKDIRTAVQATNGRVDATNSRLDAMDHHNEAMREELSRRIVDSEVRIATAVTDLHGTVRDLVDELRSQRDLRPRVDVCERDIADIKHHLNLG